MNGIELLLAAGGLVWEQVHEWMYPPFNLQRHLLVDIVLRLWCVPEHTAGVLFGMLYRGEIVFERCIEYTRMELLLNITALLSVLAFFSWNLYKFYRDLMTNPVGNRFSSMWIAFCTRRVSGQQATCTLRSIFMSTPDVVNGAARNHTHPNSARVRNNGSSFMDMYGKLSGHKTYFLQRSAADIRNGRDGCRTYHWAKDLSVKMDSYDPGVDDLLCMVDVDMYMDIPRLLSSVFQPILVSTFAPSTVSKSTGEYSYTFDEEDNVTYNVSGGASYKHMVWDYGMDTAMATTWWCGLYYINVYNVDRRRLDDDHQLILLTPIQQIVTPVWSTSWLAGHTIARLSVTQRIGDEVFLRMDVMGVDGLHRSTGKAGKHVSALITAEEDDTLASMSANSKSVDLTIASIKTAVKDVSQSEAAILCEYHRKKVGGSKSVVYPVEASVHKFQYFPKEYDPEAKSTLTPFMHPVMLGCYAPDSCKSNDQQAINGRIKDVAPPKDMSVSGKMLMYMQEFIEFLVPVPGVGHPVDFETVYDKQGRPSQRRILDLAGVQVAPVDDSGIQSFVKAEAYGKVTDPRMISTIPGVAKYNYSRYIYSFTTVLRATLWYAFGKTPLETANRVAEICQGASWASMTDLSRFDGRVSIVLRVLEKMLMLRYFHTVYRKELTELMASQQDQRAYTRFGIKYGTGTTRASGSPETADLNSTDNAFMAYVALRRTVKDGQVYSPTEAWAKLGMYGGDDGITPDVDAEVYVSTCTEVGQVLEVDEVKRGDVGVTFLSRQYGPDVWHGANDSVCDLPRQLSKLHVTPSLPPNITALEKFSEKIYAYYLTDKNTPVIGELATLVVDVFPELVPKDRNRLGLANYASQGELDVQYPNEKSDWMMDYALRVMPKFNYDKFRKWLDSVRTAKVADLLLAPPLCGEEEITHVSKSVVVVDGEVISPPPSANIPSPAAAVEKKVKKVYSPEDLARMATLPCKEGAKCKFGAKCRFKHA